MGRVNYESDVGRDREICQRCHFEEILCVQHPLSRNFTTLTIEKPTNSAYDPYVK